MFLRKCGLIFVSAQCSYGRRVNFGCKSYKL